MTIDSRAIEARLRDKLKFRSDEGSGILPFGNPERTPRYGSIPLLFDQDMRPIVTRER